MKNKYVKRSHISERRFRDILRYFAEDFDASQTAKLTRVGRKAVNRIYNKLRFRIVELAEKEAPFRGDVEIDESYFGAKRIRGKRGRVARGKTPVVGLLKRKGKVYTQVIPNCERKSLLPIIRHKVLDGSTIYTDGWKSYHGLVLNGYKHYRIHH